MVEPAPLPREPATSIGVADKLFSAAKRQLGYPKASGVGIPRTVEGRELSMKMVSLVDDISDTVFHIRCEEDSLNKMETMYIAWFSGEKQQKTPYGCIKLTKDSAWNVSMTAREYERVQGQDSWKFWNSRGPQTFVDRLDDGTHNDKPLLDEDIDSIIRRLSPAVVDKDRTWRESAIISVDNMTKVKGFKPDWRTHELYRYLQSYRVDDEAIHVLKHTSTLNVPKHMLDLLVENSSLRWFLKQLAEMKPDLQGKGIMKLIEPSVTTKLVQRFAAAYSR